VPELGLPYKLLTAEAADGIKYDIVFVKEVKMTLAEIALMQQLAEKEQRLSGNKDASGLKRLIAAGYVTETPATRGDTSAVVYTITDQGRDALRAAQAS
jgi:DNA-binding MarR family transcriptional regulator